MKKRVKSYTLIIFLAIFLNPVLIPIPSSVIVDSDSPIKIATEDYPVLIYGTGWGPGSLDPHYAYDLPSIDVIDQVVESLFASNLSDPSLTIVPRLASAMGAWSDDSLNYTVELRNDVIFHDGTTFNATTVQWNFNRLAYFLNVTGTLPEDIPITQLDPLFRWSDGTLIVNRTEVIDTYTIKFVLNKPYAALEALLSCWATGILSPTSTPVDNYIDTLTGDLVGTGPFVYDYYVENKEVRFHAFEDYRDGAAEIKGLIFSVIWEEEERNQALLSGDIDCLRNPLPSMLDTFEADPNLTVAKGQNTVISYVGMNNKQINKTIRRAISHAINYSYIIDEILEGHAVRLKSPLPEGILYANWSFDAAIYNPTKAREYMVSMGYGDLSWTDYEWQTANFLTFNYTYNIGNEVREEIFYLLQNNLSKIGIQVTKAGMSWSEFIDRGYEREGFTRDMLQLYFIGWIPDFNDPNDYLLPLFTNTSAPVYRFYSSNFAQYDGYKAAIEAGRDPHDVWDNVQLLMEQGMNETDSTRRELIYWRIQELLVEQDLPWAWCYSHINYDAYLHYITGYQSNPMDKVWFYGVSRKTPSDSIDKVITVLEELEVPPEAENEIERAIKDFEKAIEKFESGKFEDALDKLQDAVEDLMDAQDDGAHVQDVIDEIINLVREIVDQSLSDAIVMVGEDNKHVVKARDNYDTAGEKLEEGKYDKAINKFEKAYRDTMKARCDWVPKSYVVNLEDRLAEIQELKLGDISSDTLKSLNKAEGKLEDAIEKANEGKLEKSFDKLEDAIKHLENAAEYGVDTSDVIESIVENIRDVVHIKISDAELALIGGINKDIENAWDYYDEALEAWYEGNYKRAIRKFQKAIGKVEDALL